MKYKFVLGAGTLFLFGAVIFGQMGLFGFPFESFLSRGKEESCLEENQRAEYSIPDKHARPGRVLVEVFTDPSEQPTVTFEHEVRSANHYHFIELHDCRYYLLKVFNFDPKKDIQESGYREELWSYSYSQEEGRSEVLLAEKNDSGFRPYFSSDFRVDPKEQYVVLERGSQDKSDYALVIKELSTLRDVLVLTMKDVVKREPKIFGGFGLGGWQRDGEYLFGDIYDGSYSSGFYRIKRDTWEVDVWLSPPDAPAGAEGRANVAGYYAYADLTTFTGYADLTEEIFSDAAKTGRKKNLIVADLKTGKRMVVASVPLLRDHEFQLKWLSDTELEYTMPDGTKKKYRIE